MNSTHRKIQQRRRPIHVRQAIDDLPNVRLCLMLLRAVRECGFIGCSSGTAFGDAAENLANAGYIEMHTQRRRDGRTILHLSERWDR